MTAGRNKTTGSRENPLTSRDREMLHVVLQMYRTLGYTPTKQEVPNAGSLKKRFPDLETGDGGRRAAVSE